MNNLAKDYQGKHSLKFNVYDAKEGYQVSLRSKVKVALDNDFITLKQINKAEIKIN